MILRRSVNFDGSSMCFHPNMRLTDKSVSFANLVRVLLSLLHSIPNVDIPLLKTQKVVPITLGAVCIVHTTSPGGADGAFEAHNSQMTAHRKSASNMSVFRRGL